MKKIAIHLALLCFCAVGYAQEIQTKVSEPQKGIWPFFAISKDPGTTIAAREKMTSKTFEFTNFDNNLKAKPINLVKYDIARRSYGPALSKVQAIRKDGKITAVGDFKFPEGSSIKTEYTNDGVVFFYTVPVKPKAGAAYNRYGVVVCDNNLSILRKSEMNIPAAVLEEIKSDKSGVLSLHPGNVLVRKDGSYVLIAERNANDLRMGGSGNNYGEADQFSEDMVLFFLSADLKETSSYVIKKKQTYKGFDLFNSFLALEEGENILLFYNQDFKYTAEKANLLMRVITADNKVSNEKLAYKSNGNGVLLSGFPGLGISYLRPAPGEVQFIAVSGHGSDRNETYSLVQIDVK